MYRLLTGLYAHLTRKEEFNVIILGLDHSGKTTLLEKVKTIFCPSQPGLNPSQIFPTIGQNIGRITLSSTYLKFWDLGGSREIRSIWEKYYDEADAICWVVDSHDRFRNDWKTDTNSANQGRAESSADPKGKGKAKATHESVESCERAEGWIELGKILQHPSIVHSNIPVLVIANKQDQLSKPRTSKDSNLDHHDNNKEEGISSTIETDLEPQSPMTVEEVRELFNRVVNESTRSEKARSLGLSEAHVIGVSALTGQGIREAINWLFYRVATKGQSRRTQRLKIQQSIPLNKQQQTASQNTYHHQNHSNDDHNQRKDIIKLGDLSQKLNNPRHESHSTS